MNPCWANHSQAPVGPITAKSQLGQSQSSPCWANHSQTPSGPITAKPLIDQSQPCHRNSTEVLPSNHCRKPELAFLILRNLPACQFFDGGRHINPLYLRTEGFAQAQGKCFISVSWASNDQEWSVKWTSFSKNCNSSLRKTRSPALLMVRA